MLLFLVAPAKLAALDEIAARVAATTPTEAFVILDGVPTRADFLVIDDFEFAFGDWAETPFVLARSRVMGRGVAEGWPGLSRVLYRRA